jgi:type IV secretory pathway TrbL component
MDVLIDQITAGFLGALRAGGSNLAVYSIPILSLAFLIGYAREFGPKLMLHHGSVADAIAGPLLFMIVAGLYYFVLINLFWLGQQVLTLAFHWGLSVSGQALSVDILEKPSFIMTIGMQAAAPIAAFSNWWDTMASVVKLSTSPMHSLSFAAILAGFLAVMLHHVMMLIEFHLAVLLGAVLIPWGLWSATQSLAEFSVGWLQGGAVRALVSTTMLGIALPLFPLLQQTSGGSGWDLKIWVVPEALGLAVGAVLFAVLCWQIPKRAAMIAGRGVALGLHGGELMSIATGPARFALMGQGVVRGFSHLLGR